MNIIEKYLLSSPEESLYEEDEHLSDLMESVFNLLDTLDLDNLTEDQEEMLDEILEMYEADDEVSEARKEKVVRGGKKVKKLKCPAGKKAVGGKCVRMSQSEKRTRSKAAKKSSRKKKGQKASTERKRKKSMRKRT